MFLSTRRTVKSESHIPNSHFAWTLKGTTNRLFVIH